MEKKRDNALNTDNNTNPKKADRQNDPADTTAQTVTDVELSNEETTEATASTDPVAQTHTGSGSGDSTVPPPDTAATSESGKGSKGPLIGAIVVVAAIAAGGYYYSQNNQSGSDTQSATQTTSDSSSASTETPSASQADQASSTSSSASDTEATDKSQDVTEASDSSSATDSSADAASGDTASSATDSSAPAADASASSDSASEPAAEGDNAAQSGTSDTGAAAEQSKATESSGDSSTDSQSGAQADNGSATDSTAASEGSDATSAGGTSSGDEATDSSADNAATASSASQSAGADTSAGSAGSAANTGAQAATSNGSAGQSGSSLPADIRDQLDRQSAQIIALRDQLESSQKQLQQLQTSRLQASRNEASLFILNDVSRLVGMAQNELAISGNVENAVASLETAKKAIDQADAPVLAGLQGALAADIVTLKSAPVSSQDMLFTQAAELSDKIDSLPMIAPDQPGAKPLAGSSTSGNASASESQAADSATQNSDATDSSAPWYDRAWSEVKSWPAAAWNGLRSDLGGVVRVEKLADPNQVLLTVDQASQLRGNLKQNLRFAQQALLNGQQGIWTRSLETVEKGLRQSFNQDSSDTQQAIAQVQALLKAGVRPKTPEITQSVKAVQETRNQLKSMSAGQE